MSYFQNFSRHNALHVFVNLDVSFAKIGDINYKYSLIKQSPRSDDFTIRVYLLLIATVKWKRPSVTFQLAIQNKVTNDSILICGYNI